MTSEIEPKLHAWHIEPREYARHEERRGKRHAYQRLIPARTALVVIDMVRFFVSQNAYCLGIVPNIARVAGALRSAGGLVAWVLPTSGHTPNDSRIVRLFRRDRLTEGASLAGSRCL